MIINEKILVKEVKDGSEHSFRTLYLQYISRLYGFVYHYVKSETATDDIVQETFLRVWLHRERLNPDASFKSYLFTISYHLLLKELRHQLSQPLMEEFMAYRYEEQRTDNEGEQSLDFECFYKTLEKAKQKLSPRQREIFEMNKELNLPISHIAQKMSITEQVVRNQLTISLKIIRSELKHYTYLLALFLLDF